MVDLSPATHQYKFIIDGQWRHDHTAPTVLDNLGNVNNCIHVQPDATLAASGSGNDGSSGAIATGSPSRSAAKPAAGSASGGSGGGSGSSRQTAGEVARRSVSRITSDPYNLGAPGRNEAYNQVVPPRDELIVHHSASLMLPPQLRLLLPHHHGDATTMPLSVQMNHVFCHLHPVRAASVALATAAAWRARTPWRPAAPTVPRPACS